ncbi:MAG: hypothetical protein R3190_02550 [Thermoanaerobaculia bacterium]|nr:hypothetical protein [Thermoanaerobaculia bacterium]
MRHVPSVSLVAAFGVVLASGCGGQDPPPFKPVANIVELMQNVVDPAADVVWGSVGTIITEEGTHEFYPRNDEEWQLVINAAMTLTESGNLLMIGERAVDDARWMELSRDLVDAGVIALEAARSKDKERIFMIGGEVYAACDNCHSIYWVGDLARGKAFADSPP